MKYIENVCVDYLKIMTSFHQVEKYIRKFPMTRVQCQ